MDRGEHRADAAPTEPPRANTAPSDGTTPADGLETRLIRWIALLRTSWVLVGAATLIVERRHYRRPHLAELAVMASLADSLWSVRRSARRDDVVGTAISTLTGTAALVAIGASVDPADQYGGLVDWAFHAMLWTSGANAFRSPRLAMGAAITSAPVAAYTATVTLLSGRHEGVRAATNAVQFSAFFATAALLSRTLRSSGREILTAQHAALAEASKSAAERARAEAVAELHSGAFDALTATRALLGYDPGGARRIAAAEAARLRHAVRAGGRADELLTALARMAERVALADGRVELVPDMLAEPDPRLVDDAVHAAETAIAWLAGRGSPPRCVLRVVGDTGRIDLTLRQQHISSTPDAVEATASLAALLAGRVETVHVSVPTGRGIRIEVAVR